MLNAENSTLEDSEEDVAVSLAASADPVSLARLHLLNAYRRSVQDGAQPEEYRVKWEGHESHLTQQVARLEQDPDSADLTVATRGASIPAHRIVLVAASPFFRSVLQGLPASQHPVIVVRGADPRHLRYVVSFCYSGSIRIPSQDVPEVLQLAKDLEISGLSVVKPEGAALSPSLSVTPPASLRSRVFRPASPTMFPFTQPMHAHSPPTPAFQGRHEEDSLGSLKRDYSPLGLKDTQIKKRCKVEPLAARSDGDLTTLASPRSTPPASAPPLLLNHSPSTPFFRNTHLSPPNSAPPQPIRGLSPRHSSSSPSTHDLQERPPSVSLVPSSRLLQPPPAHSSTSSSPHGELPSPHGEMSSPKGEPSSPSSFHRETSLASSGRASVPQTPLALALKEPSTPSTPSTPTTPSIKSESSSRSGVGKACCSGSRVLLWRFLLDLLHNPRYTPIYIRWLDRPAGIFRIMESDMVAQLWGMARKNNNMNYEKMSRGMRTYYKRGILFHIDGTKLIYKFNTTDPDIQQCMRYYDLSQKSQEVEEEAANEQAGSSFLTSSSLSTLSSLPVLQNLPSSSVSTPTSMESLYSPLLRDIQLRPSLLYDPYLSPFLRASQRELY